MRLGKLSIALGTVMVLGGLARAANEPIDAKKIQIKDKGTDKRQIQVQSKDTDVNFSEADNPAANGASLHVFSATDDLCVQLPAANWEDKGTKFKYKDANKNGAQIKEGQLKIKIKGPVPIGYTLNEPTQGTVNAIFTSGTGQKWCMRCTAPSKDEPEKYQGKDCVAAGCPAEPSVCVPPPPAGSTLKFTTTLGTSNCGPAGLASNPAAPFSGEIDSDVAGTTKIRDLGLGCLYFGGGNATIVPPGKIPDAATTRLTISGGTLSGHPGTSAKDCSLGAGPGQHCINNNATPACVNDTGCGGAAGACALDANCYFGPPLPILSPPPFGALTTCVQNVIQTDAGGTVNTATGAASTSLPLSSRVYITGNTGSPCPKCAPTCTYGKTPGGACTATGSLQTSVDCQPSFAGFQAPLPVNLTPLTTGTASDTDPAGNFCPLQANVGAFGQPTARRIAQTGTPAGDVTDGDPHNSVLASVFCIPATNNVAVDGVADLPGPGAIGLNGTVQVE